tara:strand:+ start:397 stop:807 length:411 start_codon:yes stop_codon:yes gene_type:complete
MIKILPLYKFRRLKEFSKVFKINDDTVIAYLDTIYSNKPLYPDVLVHEMVHLAQQKEHGIDNFIKRYLNDKKFRLKVEGEAYIKQLNSIQDPGLREAVLKDTINALTSGLYGKITVKEAEKLLGIKKDKLDVSKLI